MKTARIKVEQLEQQVRAQLRAAGMEIDEESKNPNGHVVVVLNVGLSGVWSITKDGPDFVVRQEDPAPAPAPSAVPGALRQFDSQLSGAVAVAQAVEKN